MERLVVTQTQEGLWSASYDGETFATYTTEEEALSSILKRAAQRRQVGIKTVVIITREAKDGICETTPSKDET